MVTSDISKKILFDKLAKEYVLKNDLSSSCRVILDYHDEKEESLENIMQYFKGESILGSNIQKYIRNKFPDLHILIKRDINHAEFQKKHLKEYHCFSIVFLKAGLTSLRI